MIYKKVSMSILLAIALGMTACGGGDKTPKLVENNATGDQNLTVDTTAPQFASTSTSFSIVEDGLLNITTITVSDDSNVSFSLAGVDASSFELGATNTDYSKVLKFKVAPDYETKDSYSVSVVAKDSAGNEANKDISITIIDKPFSFNTTGSMGSVVEGSTGTLSLLTKENKNTVSYTLSDNTNFSLNGNQLSFLAPTYNETGSNSYTTTVTANDGDSDITLSVSATVIKDGSAPAIKTYLLKSRTDVAGGESTQYTYDNDGYLESKTLSGSNYPLPIVTTYKYFDDYSIMKGYNKYDQLQSIRVFETKSTDKNKFAATMGSHFSVDEFKNFIQNIHDSATFKHNRHISKYIYELDAGNTFAELYVYDDNDNPSRVITGTYNITSDQIGALSDLKLHTTNAPNGGFPSANTRLTSAQLAELNSGDMPFLPTQETTYRYSSGKLIGLTFFGYGEGDQDSDDIEISYYGNNTLKTFQSNDLNITYGTDSLLSQVNNNQYNFVEDGTTVTVTVTNTSLISTYIFEEE